MGGGGSYLTGESFRANLNLKKNKNFDYLAIGVIYKLWIGRELVSQLNGMRWGDDLGRRLLALTSVKVKRVYLAADLDKNLKVNSNILS